MIETEENIQRQPTGSQNNRSSCTVLSSWHWGFNIMCFFQCTGAEVSDSESSPHCRKCITKDAWLWVKAHHQPAAEVTVIILSSSCPSTAVCFCKINWMCHRLYLSEMSGSACLLRKTDGWMPKENFTYFLFYHILSWLKCCQQRHAVYLICQTEKQILKVECVYEVIVRTITVLLNIHIGEKKEKNQLDYK